MITRIYLFALFLFSFFQASSQKYYNLWTFGDSAGLNFNTSPVSFFKSASPAIEQSHCLTSISDKEGNLLFYTDGITLWGFNHKVIPRYLGRWPWSGTAKPLICPYTNNDSMFYLFGVSDNKYANRLQYLTIKTKLGRAEIVYPQPSTLTNFFTVLSENTSIAVSGTAHCNQKDTWIVAHSAGALNAFLVTENGVSTTPVVSQIPAAVTSAANLNVGISNFKFAANGERMIIPLMDENKLLAFEFNNQTGKFLNPVKLGIPDGELIEDAELSPDGSKLYVATWIVDPRDPEIYAEWHYVYQMDLNAGDASQIEKSRIKINGNGERVICWERSCYIMHRTMQLGPDSRIYLNRRTGDKGLDVTLSVIETPNKAGLDANYTIDAVNIKRQYKYINYNYIRSGSFTLRENGIQVQKKTCADRPVDFSLLYTKIDSVKWNFGDPASGDNNVSRSFTPQHTYPAPGDYLVSAIIYKNCISDTARTTVTIQTDKSVRVPLFLKDTTVCIGNELQLDATAPFAKTYKWENGLIFPARTIKDSGTYAITLFNECSFDSRSFKVVFQECPCNLFVPSAFTPNNDGLNDEFKAGGGCASITAYRLKVFSRYGDVVYQSDDFQKGWNGKIGSTEAPTGVYVWILEARNPNNKQLIQQKGTVMLLR